MFRRSSATIRTLLGAAMVATLVAACGNATATTTPAPARTAAPSTSAGTSPGSSAGAPGSPGGSASAAAPTIEPSLDISAGLAHLDAKLESLLPGTIGEIPLAKLSMPLSTYIASLSCDASNPCGDKALYTPWLVGLGKTPDDATLAAATDLTGTEKIVIEAFKVPGKGGAELSSTFAAQARKAGWPVSQKTVAAKSVQELIDVARQNLGLVSIGYLYFKDDVMYLVLTDDPALLVESLIKLP
ncbi:MAG TPA: hypothetical protein VF344_03355 [Candidatus Limnocylindrales bacterium]